MSIEKLNIAIEHLDNALNCFYNRKAFHSAILCAGAGQEIMGKYLLEYEQATPEDVREAKYHHIGNVFNRLEGREDVKKNLIRKALRSEYNSTKHMNGLPDAAVYYEPNGAAASAIYNSMKHYLRLSKYIQMSETILINRCINELKNDPDFDFRELVFD